MTSDNISTPIESAVAFETALAALIESAAENDVNVRGAWELDTSGSTHHWEVNVVELARRDD